MTTHASPPTIHKLVNGCSAIQCPVISGRTDEPERHARIQQVLDYANGVNKSSQITQIEPEHARMARTKPELELELEPELEVEPVLKI